MDCGDPQVGGECSDHVVQGAVAEAGGDRALVHEQAEELAHALGDGDDLRAFADAVRELHQAHGRLVSRIPLTVIETPPFLEHIRAFIGDIEEMRHYTSAGVSSEISIYEAAGGLPAFEALAERMHEAMAADDLLGDWFSRAAPEHVPHLAKWLAQVFGGPSAYTDELGDIALILEKHAGLDIPEPKRARFEAIGAASAQAQWPDRPDVADAVARYVAWGTTVAVENSRPDHVPDPTAGVPVWGWDD